MTTGPALTQDNFEAVIAGILDEGILSGPRPPSAGSLANRGTRIAGFGDYFPFETFKTLSLEKQQGLLNYIASYAFRGQSSDIINCFHLIQNAAGANLVQFSDKELDSLRGLVSDDLKNIPLFNRVSGEGYDELSRFFTKSTKLADTTPGTLIQRYPSMAENLAGLGIDFEKLVQDQGFSEDYILGAKYFALDGTTLGPNDIKKLETAIAELEGKRAAEVWSAPKVVTPSAKAAEAAEAADVAPPAKAAEAADVAPPAKAAEAADVAPPAKAAEAAEAAEAADVAPPAKAAEAADVAPPAKAAEAADVAPPAKPVNPRPDPTTPDPTTGTKLPADPTPEPQLGPKKSKWYQKLTHSDGEFSGKRTAWAVAVGLGVAAGAYYTFREKPAEQSWQEQAAARRAAQVDRTPG
jgi:hypothetical protein